MDSPTDCSSNNGFHPINQFALVSYIPHPLGQYLDELRLNLVPACKPHAHVTILPPRPLCDEPEKAAGEIRRLADDFSPFTVRLGEIARFPISDVIYIELDSGIPELKSMYRAMNSGASSFSEAFAYHPHITLAQNLVPEKVHETLEKARQEWARCPYERSFRVETLHFVQNTNICKWLDLAEFPLPVHAAH